MKGAKQSLEQTKEIVNDTKQTANDEKIDTEKNISMMTYFKKNSTKLWG